MLITSLTLRAIRSAAATPPTARPRSPPPASAATSGNGHGAAPVARASGRRGERAHEELALGADVPGPAAKRDRDGEPGQHERAGLHQRVGDGESIPERRPARARRGRRPDRRRRAGSPARSRRARSRPPPRHGPDARRAGLSPRQPASGRKRPSAVSRDATHERADARAIRRPTRAEEAPAVEHEGAGTERGELVEVGRDQHDRAAGRGRAASSAVHVRGRGDVEAARRIDGDQDAGRRRAPGRSPDAADCRRRARRSPDPDRRGRRGARARARRRTFVPRSASSTPGARKARQQRLRENRVLPDREPERQAVASAIRRDECDARRSRPDDVTARSVRPPTATTPSRSTVPQSAPASSSCPLPSTPATPQISPASTAKATSRSATRASLAGVARRSTLSAIRGCGVRPRCVVSSCNRAASLRRLLP